MLSMHRGTGRKLIDTAVTPLRFAIIGAGRLGGSLALALRAAGAVLTGYTAHSPEGRARADAWLGGVATVHLDDLVARAPDLYVVSVPDRALDEVAAELGAALAAAGTRQAPASPTATPGVAPVVAHTSGATSVRVLDPCLRAGAATLVFHPLQTFTDPSTGCDRFAGTAVAITGGSSETGSPAVVLGFAVAVMLGAKPFLLPDDKRSLYHAAASVACNYFVTLEHHAESLFVEAGLPPANALSVFLPLVRATLDNMATQGTVKALTGPLSRGDVKTVAAHLTALASDAPHLLSLYRTLGLATLDIVRARQEVDPALVDRLTLLLGQDDAAGPVG
jgi:predicted short-subunit dehydrogenase-like oxidoreductase (DUF2520 family)